VRSVVQVRTVLEVLVRVPRVQPARSVLPPGLGVSPAALAATRTWGQARARCVPKVCSVLLVRAVVEPAPEARHPTKELLLVMRATLSAGTHGVCTCDY